MLPEELAKQPLMRAPLASGKLGHRRAGETRAERTAGGRGSRSVQGLEERARCTQDPAGAMAERRCVCFRDDRLARAALVQRRGEAKLADDSPCAAQADV